MSLNVQALRVFVAVVENGGFSRAAARLRLSQPAVSKAVLALERQQGLVLVERGSRSVQATRAGVALYERALEMFAVERSAEEELHAHRTLEKGVLRIGASTTIATYMLPALLGEFRAAHPGLQLRIVSANTRDIARALLLRRLDIALVEGPVTHERLQLFPWRTDEMVVIAAPEHPLSQKRAPLPPALINGCEFVRRERGSGTREVAEAALAALGIAPRFSLTLGTTEAVKQSVAAGLGLAIISRAAVVDQLALGRVVELRIADFAVNRQLSRMQLVGRSRSPAAVAFDALLELSNGTSRKIPTV
jgi:DNA-binding transcriptional LysR family regulator